MKPSIAPNPIKVTDFRLRDLRTEGATEMYRAGVDIHHIQRLLGHRRTLTQNLVPV